MSINRDKEHDIAKTKKAINAALHDEAGKKNWLGHKVGSKAYNIDFLLLRGATEEEIREARGDEAEGHLGHLKRDHGIQTIIKDGRRFFDI
jgi:hypothetical protein